MGLCYRSCPLFSSHTFSIFNAFALQGNKALRVLFLSSDTGGGHRASAQALAKQVSKVISCRVKIKRIYFRRTELKIQISQLHHPSSSLRSTIPEVHMIWLTFGLLTVCTPTTTWSPPTNISLQIPLNGESSIICRTPFPTVFSQMYIPVSCAKKRFASV